MRRCFGAYLHHERKRGFGQPGYTPASERRDPSVIVNHLPLVCPIRRLPFALARRDVAYMRIIRNSIWLGETCDAIMVPRVMRMILICDWFPNP